MQRPVFPEILNALYVRVKCDVKFKSQHTYFGQDFFAKVPDRSFETLRRFEVYISKRSMICLDSQGKRHFTEKERSWAPIMI